MRVILDKLASVKYFASFLPRTEPKQIVSWSNSINFSRYMSIEHTTLIIDNVFQFTNYSNM